jgi:hypothetical protein
VSTLLPNLPALLAQLGGDIAEVSDARSLAESAAYAENQDDLDTAIAAVIAGWRRAE